MASGDVVLDRTFDVDQPAGVRVDLFACRDPDRPGGYKYSFQCYDRETGETLLRYDNAHDHPAAGWHHRHEGETTPEAITFDGLASHLRRFRSEVTQIDD